MKKLTPSSLPPKGSSRKAIKTVASFRRRLAAERKRRAKFRDQVRQFLLAHGDARIDQRLQKWAFLDEAAIEFYCDAADSAEHHELGKLLDEATR